MSYDGSEKHPKKTHESTMPEPLKNSDYPLDVLLL